MVRRWDQWKNPWDREYAKRGRLWRGSASIDPLPRLAPAPGPVAEIGSGDGKFMAALGASGYRCVGLDFSRRGLRLVPRRAGMELVQADARRMPLRDASFPVACARYLLGALLSENRETAAREMGRVVRPGGLLLVEEFTPDDFRYGSGAEVESDTFERNEGITTHYFREKELRSAWPEMELVETVSLRHSLRVSGEKRPRAALRLVLRRAV